MTSTSYTLTINIFSGGVGLDSGIGPILPFRTSAYINRFGELRLAFSAAVDVSISGVSTTTPGLRLSACARKTRTTATLVAKHKSGATVDLTEVDETFVLTFTVFDDDVRTRVRPVLRIDEPALFFFLRPDGDPSCAVFWDGSIAEVTDENQARVARFISRNDCVHFCAAHSLEIAHKNIYERAKDQSHD